MSFTAAGQPLHTRTLSISLARAEPPRVGLAAYVLDLRKRGIAPVGGDLQGPGVIHHMLLDGTIDEAARRLVSVQARMPAVAFEASPASGGESCRDLIGRVDHLAGLPLDDGYARALGVEIGGPRGCSHILTLAHLVGPTATWAFDADRRAHGEAARRPAERIFRRDITIDGYETAPGELALTLQLNDLHFAPSPAVARAMERFGAQTEITARALVSAKDLLLHDLELSERRRTAAEIGEAAFRDRSADAAALVGRSLRSGISAAILTHFAGAPHDAPLRDALLQLAPTLVQCFAALDIWSLAPGSTAAGDIGGMPDSCWMWRSGGALGRNVQGTPS